MTVVTLINVLTNVAYFTVVNAEEMKASDAVAVQFGARVFSWMTWPIPLVVAVSVFGTMNGNIFSAARVIQAGAEEGHFPLIGAMLHRTTDTPLPALLFNALLNNNGTDCDWLYLVPSFIYLFICFVGDGSS